MSKAKKPKADHSEEYERFEALAQGLIEVPKAEIDAAMQGEKRKKAKVKKSPRPATASQ